MVGDTNAPDKLDRSVNEQEAHSLHFIFKAAIAKSHFPVVKSLSELERRNRNRSIDQRDKRDTLPALSTYQNDFFTRQPPVMHM